MATDDAIEGRLLALAQTHPAIVDFRQTRPAAVEQRHVLAFAPEHVADNLTASTLAGADRIAPRPYVLVDDEAGVLLALFHLGRKLAGHAGLVHGGVPAILLDEAMGRACFPHFARRVGVTASLALQYKSAIPVGSVVLVRAEMRPRETGESRRKAWVDAVVEDAEEGEVRVTATALFVEPRWAVDRVL